MRVFLGIIVFVLLFSCGRSTQDGYGHLHAPIELHATLDTNILGTYSNSGAGFNTSNYIKLDSEQRFSYRKWWSSCTGGGKNKITEGCYTIENNHIKLFPDIYIENDIEGFGIAHRSDTIPYRLNDTTYIPTSYYPIKWGDYNFLVSDEHHQSKVFDSKKDSQLEVLARMYRSKSERDSYRLFTLHNSPAKQAKEKAKMLQDSTYDPYEHAFDLYGYYYRFDVHADFDTLQIPEKYRHLFRNL